MPRRVALPLSGDRRLDLERARKKLGGPAHSSGASAGEVGAVVTVGSRSGVVLFVDEETVDVWFEEDVLRRVRVSELGPATADARSPLGFTASAARTFGRLREGDTLHLDGQPVTLVEKCRWGALVARPDGRILAVGFKRLAAAAAQN